MPTWLRKLARAAFITFVLLLAVAATGVYKAAKFASQAEMPGALTAERAALPLTGAACGNDASCLLERAPIASYAEYRRCGGYVTSGKLGLDQIACSESWVTDAILRIGGPANSFYRQFRRACRTHDFCYVHAAATYSPDAGPEAVRKSCDKKLLADVVRDCRLLYPLHNDENRGTCLVHGMAAYSAIRWLGGDSRYFSKERTPICDFEPGPHAPRDTVISGRFLAGDEERVATLVEDPARKTLLLNFYALNDQGSATAALEPIVLDPAGVSVADAAAACALRDFRSGEDCTAPKLLSDGQFEATDWLRFAPVVVDSDGDGIDEIVLVSLTAKLGLVLTHIKFRSEAGASEAELRVVPEVAAYVAVDGRTGKLHIAAKEFGPAAVGGSAPMFASERALQMFSHQLVVTQRAPLDCAPLPDQGPEDLVMFGSRGEPEARRDDDEWEDSGIEAIKRRMYRFYFEADAAGARWHMKRDGYSDDQHKMSQCAGMPILSKKRDREHQLFRLQYPAFATRGPVKCSVETDGRRTAVTTVIRESLSSITREKCPSSTAKASAGDLHDVDLVSYTFDPAYTGDDGEIDPDIKLKIARTTWYPLTWNEAADPVMTSRAARRAGIMMANVYVGGIKEQVKSPGEQRRFMLVSLMVSDDRLKKATKDAWRQRLPDTVGIPPRQLAILKSDRSSDLPPHWPRGSFGDPRIFLRIPSVLAPFWLDGSEGVSLILFANRAAFDQEAPAAKPASEAVKKGTLQFIIVPLVRGQGGPLESTAQGPLGEPRWVECDVPPDVAAAIPGAGGAAGHADEFLYHEQVLPGHFFPGKKGGLAIAYRTSAGDIGFTSLRPFGRLWKLGDTTCRTLSQKSKYDNAPAPERDVWMMHLN